MTPPLEDLLTMKEVMDRLRVSRGTVYRLIDQGKLTPIKVGKGVRFAQPELEAFLGQAPMKSYHSPSAFTVKEGGSGEPFLAVEPLNSGLPQLEGMHMFLMAREGVTLSQIEELKRMLNERIAGVSLLAQDLPALTDGSER